MKTHFVHTVLFLLGFILTSRSFAEDMPTVMKNDYAAISETPVFYTQENITTQPAYFQNARFTYVSAESGIGKMLYTNPKSRQILLDRAVQIVYVASSDMLVPIKNNKIIPGKKLQLWLKIPGDQIDPSGNLIIGKNKYPLTQGKKIPFPLRAIQNDNYVNSGVGNICEPCSNRPLILPNSTMSNKTIVICDCDFNIKQNERA
jgi:hypothetical protein